MNSENRQKLLDMIEEGERIKRSLAPGEVSDRIEQVPNTNIWVPKDMSDLFNAYATIFYKDYLDDYFRNNNVFQSPSINVNYAQEAYNLLKKEMLEEKNEYYISKAAEIYDNNKAIITRIGELNGIIPNIEAKYKELLEQKRSLDEAGRNGFHSQDLTDQFAKTKKTLEDELEMIRTSKSNVASELQNLQKAINKNFVNAITDEMRRIEENYYNNFSNSERTFSKSNGMPILIEDEPEYEALITLLSIQNNVDFSKETFIINNCVCVNENQIEFMKQNLNQVELFKRMTIVKEKTLTPEEANKELLEKIVKRLREIEKTSSSARKDFTYFKPDEMFGISSDDKKDQNLSPAKDANLDQLNIFINDDSTLDKDTTKKTTSRGIKISNNLLEEYENLFNIMRMLNKATYHKTWKLVPVWDNLAYVDVVDEQAIKRAFASSSLFADLNPKKKQVAKNAELIDEIKKEIYIRVKDQIKATNESKTPIPIRKIGTIDGNDIVVLEADFPECSNLFELINILQDTQDEDLELVMGIAYIKHDNKSKFTNLYNMTKYFNKAKILAKAIVDKENEIRDLIQKAETVPAADLSANGLVAADDADKLEALKRELVALKKSADRDAKEEDILKDINQKAFGVAAQNRINKEKIASVKEDLKKFSQEHSDMTNLSDEDYNYNLWLTELLKILEDSRKASTLIQVGDAKIADDPNCVKRYKELVAKIDEYKNSQKTKDETLLSTEAKMQELKDKMNGIPENATSVQTQLYNLYEELHDILEKSLSSTNTEDGLRIATEYVPRYKEIKVEIEKLENRKEYNLPEIKNLEKQIQELKDQKDMKNITTISILSQLLQILKMPTQNNLSPSELKQIDGVYIPLDKEEDYHKLHAQLKDVNNKNAKPNPIPPQYDSILPQNVSTIAKIGKELADIVVDSNREFYKDKLKPASDGQMILENLLPRYELLLEQRDILRRARTNDGTDNIQINEGADRQRYEEIIKKLANTPQDLFDNDDELEDKKPRKKQKEPKKAKRHRVKKKRKAKEKSESFWNRTIKAGLSSIIDSVVSAIGEPLEHMLPDATNKDKDILIGSQRAQAFKNFNTEIVIDKILAESSIADKRIVSEFNGSEDPELAAEAELARKRIADRYERLIKNNYFIKDEAPKKAVDNDYEKLEKREKRIQTLLDNCEDPEEKIRLEKQIVAIMREKNKMGKPEQKPTTAKDILTKYYVYKDLASRVYDDKLLTEFNKEETAKAFEELKNIPDLAQTINSRIGTLDNELYNYYRREDKDTIEVQKAISKLEIEYDELESVAKLVGINLSNNATPTPAPAAAPSPDNSAPTIDSVYKIYDDIADIASLVNGNATNSDRVISPDELDKAEQAKEAMANIDVATILNNRISELDNEMKPYQPRLAELTPEEQDIVDNIIKEHQKISKIIKTFNIDIKTAKPQEPTPDNIDTLDVEPPVVGAKPQDNASKPDTQGLKEAYAYYNEIQKLQIDQQKYDSLSNEAIECGVKIANYITKINSIENIATLIQNRLAEVSPSTTEYMVLNNIVDIVKTYNPNININVNSPSANAPIDNNQDLAAASAPPAAKPNQEDPLTKLYNLYNDYQKLEESLSDPFVAQEVKEKLNLEKDFIIEQMKAIKNIENIIIDKLFQSYGTPEYKKINAIQELMYGPNEDRLTK